MVKRTALLIEVVILVLIAQSVVANAQICDVYLRSNHYPTEIDRDGFVEFQVPIYFGTDCPIWAFEFFISGLPVGSIRPIDFDTTGSIFSYWGEDLHVINWGPKKLKIWGMCNNPSNPQSPLDSVYDGLVGNVIYKFGCGYQTCLDATIYLDSVRFTDEYGIWYDVGVVHGGVLIGPDVTGMGVDDTTLILHGDANCNGMVLGSDIVYLVNYFRGFQDCPCSKCAGDANDDGNILGSDVTWMVRYFRGEGPDEPIPCEFIPCP